MKIRILKTCKEKRPDGKLAPFAEGQVLACDPEFGDYMVKKKLAEDVTSDKTIQLKSKPITEEENG